MEIAEAKALTEALTGKVLPTKREKIAAAVYGSLNALYLVAKEKEVTIEGSSPIKHFIALTASRLVDEEKSDKEIRAYALDVITTDYATLCREGIPEAAPRLSRYAVDIVRFIAQYGKEYAGAVLGRATDADTYSNIALMLHKEKPLTDEEEEVAEILKKHALCK